MSNENELLEPLATEAGQLAIARAINNLSSLEYAVRAERAATTATQKADEASNSADDASDYATEARNWATKTDGYVEQETITIPPEQEGDEPTTETIDLYSARYYAALALDIYNNLQFDSVPTENSTALVSSGAIYTALNGKADKSDTYTKTEVDTALSNVQGQLTFDNVPTANSDNPVKSSGIKTALDDKQDSLTFDSTPTANSTNPVTSGGVYTALQNVNIDIDDEITEDSDNPVTSAAIWEALLNIEVTGGVGNASGVLIVLLYENSDGIENGTITLSEDWNNYDIINVVGGTGYYSSFIYTKLKFEEIKGDSSKYLFLNTMADSAYYCSLRIPNNNLIEIVQGANNHKLPISKVYGIKFSKNLSEQMYSNVLYENASGVNSGTITLNDNWDNYDFIGVHYGIDTTMEEIFDKSTLINNKNNNKYTSVMGGNGNTRWTLTDYNKFVIDGTGNVAIKRVVGIKLAKGGYSGIVSDARMTVKSGTLTWTSSINANQTISMDVVFDSPMPDTNYTVLFSLASGIAGHNKSIPRVNQSYKSTSGFTMKMWVDTQIPCTSNDPYVLDWVAIRPNSYTREGMVEDVLFSNASGVNSGTINLSGNISDYDLIIFTANATNGYNNFVNNIYTSSLVIELNESTPLGNNILIHGHGTTYLRLYYVTDTSLIFIPNNNENMKIVKITGIKFGRYVSGVAVDTTVTQGSNSVVTSGAVYDALQNYTPSGGGSGGSITVDTTITENSLNPVTSAAIYSALLNLPSGDVYRLSTTPYGFIPTCSDTFLRNTANQLIFTSQYGGSTYLFYKTNDYPAIMCQAKTRTYNNQYYDLAWIIAISSSQDALNITKSPSSNNGFAVLSSGQIYDENNNYNWYYKVYLAYTHPNGSGGLYYLNSSTTYISPILAVQDLLDTALPTFTSDANFEVKEDLFSPTNYNFNDGDTISNDPSNNIIKSLILGRRPIKINNETYYPIKILDGLYYYENPNNLITIDLSYEITIVPKNGSSDDLNVNIYELSTTMYSEVPTCSSTYLRDKKDDIILRAIAGDAIHLFYKTNDYPAIMCYVKTKTYNNQNYEWAWIVAVSSSQDALNIYKTEGGSSRTMTVASSGLIYDSNTNYTWYYKVYLANVHPNGSGLYYMNSSVTYSDPLLAVQDLLNLALPTFVRDLNGIIKQELFNPINYIANSGDTISNDPLVQLDTILKTLIIGRRPIKINGETYYPIKVSNQTYYYENPNNIITIDSSWVITITAKSSGGGSSITVDSTITQGGTNPVEGGAIYTALGDKADKSTTYTKTEVDTALGNKQGTLTFDTAPTSGSTNPVTSGGVYTALQNLPTGTGDVTTNTDQNITGTKTFVGSKKVGFKQSAANDKLGFTLFGNTGTERGYLEFNPLNTIDGVAGLMTLGNYATSAASLTQVGFRRYSNISGLSGAYNLLMPMIADARTPFSLTTSYQNFYLPLGFTNGTTTVRTAKSGVVDLSPLLASLEARIAALEGN